MAMSQAKLVETLEALVDSEQLDTVLVALHLVCCEKSEHILCNWQDKATAQVWDRAARAIRKAAENSSVITVS